MARVNGIFQMARDDFILSYPQESVRMAELVSIFHQLTVIKFRVVDGRLMWAKAHADLYVCYDCAEPIRGVLVQDYIGAHIFAKHQNVRK